MIDDEVRTTSRSGKRESLAPLLYSYYTAFIISCKSFPGNNRETLGVSHGEGGRQMPADNDADKASSLIDNLCEGA